MQSRLLSLLESIVNIVFGFFINTSLAMMILHAQGYEVPFKANVKVSLFLTLVSVCRMYLVRRFFNMAEKDDSE